MKNVADIKADGADAIQNATKYRHELSEIYRYFMPYRQPTAERANETGGKSEGAPLTTEIYDGTALAAAANFAGTMQADWMPPFEAFFKLEAGPLVPEDDKKALNEGLGPVTKIVDGVLPPVRLTAHEMMFDLFAGTGAMYMGRGDKRYPVRAQTAPPIEIALSEGPWGDVEGITWQKNYKSRQVEEMWGSDGKFCDELASALKDRKANIKITQHTYWDAKDERWHLCVWSDKCKDNTPFIVTEDNRTSRWVTPRFFKVPGETMGRGLAHLALPFVKSANKARELALWAAAFAILGIWMRRNDGVFNPDTAEFKPLAMWTVATTGGPLGATIQRMPVPQDFDVSSIVMADEREQIKRVTFDDELPELQDRVRSPTEIAARLRRNGRNKGGTGSRISHELVTPIVQNAIDILETSGKLKTNITIDQLLTMCSVTSPAAAAQRADKVEHAVAWIELILSMFGAEAAMIIVKIEELLPELGRWMGVEERFIRNKGEQGDLRDVLAKIVVAMQASQAKGAAKPPPAAQPYVNGGAI